MKRVYVDMDGVLAKWNEQATREDYHLHGYFAAREPMQNMVNAIKILIKEGFLIKILSCCPTEWAVTEKRDWLSVYIPEIKKEDMFFVPRGISKSIFIEKSDNDILLDDFSKNLLEWHGFGIKVLNGINGTKKTWKGFAVSSSDSPDKIAKDLKALIKISEKESEYSNMRITKYRTELDKNMLNVLVKEESRNYSVENFNDPGTIVTMLNSVYRMNKQAEEYLYMMAFNNKNKILGTFEISHGTVNASICNPRDVFVKALLCGATSIVLAHNHPSQDPTPSKEDIAVCKRVSEAGEIIGIRLLDSIIIGNEFYSFKEHSLI